MTREVVRAAFQPATYDEDAGTIDMMVSTGAPVRRYSPKLGGLFLETLEVSRKAVDLSALNLGANLLDNHDAYTGVRAILGVVTRAWLRGAELWVTVRLTTQPEWAGVVGDIRAGIIKNCSIGYDVDAYVETTKRGDKLRSFTAKRWIVQEVSLTGRPAEAGASTRSAGSTKTHLVTILGPEGSTRTMDEDQAQEFGTGVEGTPSGEQRSEAGDGGGGQATATPSPEGQQRSEPEPAPAQAPAAQRSAEGDEAVRAEAIRQERARIAEINQRCGHLHLSDEFRQSLINSDTPLEGIRAACAVQYTEERAAADTMGDGGRRQIAVGQEGLQKRQAAASAAIMSRLGVELSDEERAAEGDFARMSVLDMSAELLTERGAIGGRHSINRDQLVERSLMSSSDLPGLLQSAGQRSLLAQYESMPPTWQPWARINSDVPDYRTLERMRVGDVPKLEEVPEGGKYPEGQTSESKETFKVKKYGHIVSFTEEMMINDDLGALRQALSSEADMIRELESDLVYDLLLSDPKLSDNKGIYHADRKNTSALPLDEAGLSKLEELMLLQRSKAGKQGRQLNLRPKFLLVPPALWTKARQLMAGVVASTSGDVNVFSGAYQVIVEGRLQDNSETAYYLLTEPNRMPTIEVGFLRGQTGPQFAQEMGFDRDAIRFKAKRVIGVGAMDFRGITKSTGV